jgi:hypothetical protein
VGYEDEFSLSQIESGAWTTYSGQDAHSLVANSVNELFVNPTTFDLHLLSTSPAVDSGTSVDAPSEDYDGGARPHGSGYDIGAYEYGAATVTTTIGPTTTSTAGPSTTTTVESTTTSTGECTDGSCVTTGECTAALGRGWICQDGCCERAGACPLSVALENDESQLDTIRAFRDNVLSQSSTGRELIKLYYQWGPAIVEMMERDEEFKQDVKEMMEGVLELITGVE